MTAVPGGAAPGDEVPGGAVTGRAVPGGGVPVREWESALAELDGLEPDERTHRAQDLLSRLEDALEAL